METILAIDFDKWASATYAVNFPDVEVRCASVADQNAQEAIPYADIYLGGPPCQPHSLAGKREASKDKRDCGPDFVGAVEFRQPRMFLMENVDGLMSSENGRYAQRLLKSMEEAGYVVQIKILDAVSFGVPQFRVRCWWWGIRADLYRDGMRHVWPKPTHAWPPPEACMFGAALEAGITVGQALGLDGWLKKDTGAGFVERGGERRLCSTEEPAQTVTTDNVGGAGCRRTFIARGQRGTGITERHGDRPVSPITEPSPTVGNGDNGSSRMYLQSHADPAQTIDKPAPALRSGGGGHDGCCLRLQYDHGVAFPDEPSSTIKAGGNYDDTGKQGGGCPPVLAMYALNRPAPTLIGGSAASHTNGLSIINDRRWRESFGALSWKKTEDGLWVRRLTPLECMRLQSAPDDFRWPDGIGKTAMYRVCGNGWASRMGEVFAEAFASVDPESRTVVDLFSGGGLGAVGWHGRCWKYR